MVSPQLCILITVNARSSTASSDLIEGSNIYTLDLERKKRKIH